jgi:hypothetical protein
MHLRPFLICVAVTAVYSNVVDVYNLTSGTWGTAALSLARKDVSAVSLQNFGVAIFAGGWSMLRCRILFVSYSAFFPFFMHFCNQIFRMLLFFMIRVAVGVPSNVVDIFNATSGSWSTAVLSSARSYLSAAALPDLALFAGGWGKLQTLAKGSSSRALFYFTPDFPVSNQPRSYKWPSRCG